MKTVKVYILSEDKKTQKIVEAKLIEDRGQTILVELPDGNRIKRSKKRHLPQETNNES